MVLCFFVLVLVFGQNLPRFDIALSVVRWKNACFPLFYVCKSLNSGEVQTKNSPSKRFCRRKMRFWARKSIEEKKEIPRKRWISSQNRPNRTKKGSFGREITGRGSSEKTDFTADFAMLWSSKMGANEFFSHFFSAKSCRECRNALPLHSQSGSNALAREGYALIGNEAAKALLWSLKVLHNRL